MHAHQMTAGFLVGRIEIDDSRCNLGLYPGGYVVCDQAGAEAAYQPVIDGLAFREHPDPKRGIEVVHTFEDLLAKIGRIEQQGMHAAIFRQPDNAFDINLNLRSIEMDREASCRK